MVYNFRLAKLINNGATFYYRRIVSLQRPGTGQVGTESGWQWSQNPSKANKVEQLCVLRVLM